MNEPSAAFTARRRRVATAGGFGAILLWSTTIALARSLSEQLGAVGAGAAVYGVSALVCTACLLGSASKRRQVWRLSRKHLLGRGLLFLAYALLLFLAVGRARGDRQVLEVGLLNYLWPALTLVFSVTLLGKKARPLLIPGTALALSGVVLVLTQGRGLSWSSLARNVGDNPSAYAFGFLAAVTWALYSVLTRRWAGDRSAGGVHFFLPATAIVLLAVYAMVEAPRVWTLRAGGEAAFLGCATYLSYGLWDRAMREGDVVLLGAGSYLTPLLSTVVTCLYLGIRPEPALWLGCGLLILGSFLSWRSIQS